jgi:hypothetical protein
MGLKSEGVWTDSFFGMRIMNEQLICSSTMGVEILLEERKNGGRDHVPGKLVERWPKTVESRASGVHLPNGIGDFKKRVKGAFWCKWNSN